MTLEEENRLLSGPFPWRGPGFIVSTRGLIRDLPPSINWKEKVWGPESRETESLQKIRKSVWEETNGMSRADLHATIEITREQLALEWEKLNRHGERVVEEYEALQSWIADGIRDPYRDDPKRPERPRSTMRDRVETLRPWNEVLRGPAPHTTFGNQYFRVYMRMPPPTKFFSTFGTANILLRRYKTLKERSKHISLGPTAKRGDYDNPSPSARKALSAVARLDREHDGLAEMDIRDVWDYVEEEVVGLVNARANVRQDMRGRNKAPDRYPENTEELLELAREVASERSQTFANRPKP